MLSWCKACHDAREGDCSAEELENCMQTQAGITGRPRLVSLGCGALRLINTHSSLKVISLILTKNGTASQPSLPCYMYEEEYKDGTDAEQTERLA